MSQGRKNGGSVNLLCFAEPIFTHTRETGSPFQVEENYNLQTEQTLGVKCPSSFRQKVMKDNGGSIERSKAKAKINRK
jgi:hypothetical protein